MMEETKWQCMHCGSENPLALDSEGRLQKEQICTSCAAVVFVSVEDQSRTPPIAFSRGFSEFSAVCLALACVAVFGIILVILGYTGSRSGYPSNGTNGPESNNLDLARIKRRLAVNYVAIDGVKWKRDQNILHCSFSLNNASRFGARHIKLHFAVFSTSGETIQTFDKEIDQSLPSRGSLEIPDFEVGFVDSEMKSAIVTVVDAESY